MRNYGGLKFQDVEKSNFCVFFCEKRPRRRKFSKFCSERIHRLNDRRVIFKFREIGQREIGKIVRCLPEKKFCMALQQSSSRCCADRAQNLPGPGFGVRGTGKYSITVKSSYNGNSRAIGNVTRNCKHRRAAAKPAACAKPLMLSTAGKKGKRE